MGLNADYTLVCGDDESTAVAQMNAWCVTRWDFCDAADTSCSRPPACGCEARPWFLPVGLPPQTPGWNRSGRIWVAYGRNVHGFGDLFNVWDGFGWKDPASVVMVVDDERRIDDGLYPTTHRPERAARAQFLAWCSGM